MKLCLIWLTIILPVTTILADTMIIGNKTYTGLLQGFENGRFIFWTGDRKTIKKPRTNVKSLTITTPCRATYTEKGILHESLLIKYEKSNFFFKSKTKEEKKIYGGTIKNLIIHAKSPYEMQQRDIPRDHGLKTSLNIKELVNSEHLTDSQKTAINSYVKARKAYIQFQKESSIIVRQRDQAKGKKREEFIGQLHLRKNAEQPLKNELRISVSQLDNEFSVKLE